MKAHPTNHGHSNTTDLCHSKYWKTSLDGDSILPANIIALAREASNDHQECYSCMAEWHCKPMTFVVEVNILITAGEVSLHDCESCQQNSIIKYILIFFSLCVTCCGWRWHHHASGYHGFSSGYTHNIFFWQIVVHT